MTKEFLEATLREERRGYLSAYRYERTEERSDYRNGSYRRDLLTSYGLIRGIRVPRCRKKGFVSGVLPRYKTREKRVTEVLKAMCVVGVSRRRTRDVTAPLLGSEVSPGTVSKIFAELQSEVRTFHRRPLKDEYQVLFLDGIYVSIMETVRAKKRAVLVAYGIKGDGTRELVHFQVARSESKGEWEGFLNSLYRRGLTGEGLKLVVTDGAKGLKGALDTVYPYPKRQLCWAHKIRNVANYLPKKYREECMRGARKLYTAESKRGAMRKFTRWKEEWGSLVPRAVKSIERELHRLFNFYDFPEEQRKKLRTTNAIERCMREVRRRTYANGCFAHRESCERVLYAVVAHMNEKWRGKVLKEFREE
jgi:transposase-like protein